jgi:methylmalonyl-CoA mutase cobalamin-binding domain/chain
VTTTHRPLPAAPGRQFSSGTHTLRVLVGSRGRREDDRGAGVIARALSDLDLELTHIALDQSAEQIIDAVLLEDADALALPILSAADLVLLPRLAELLQDAGNDVLMTLSGPNRAAKSVDAWSSSRLAPTRPASAQEVIDAIESRLGLVPADAIRVLRRSLRANGPAVGSTDGNREAVWAFFALRPAAGGR